MDNQRVAVLRLTLLRLLDQVGGYKFPQHILFIHLNAELAVTEAELVRELSWLADKGYVEHSIDSISQKKLWVITEAGRERLPKISQP